MGYSSKTSRAITYGPTKYGGLDFHDLAIKEGVESI
jgi:hypothetical protein